MRIRPQIVATVLAAASLLFQACPVVDDGDDAGPDGGTADATSDVDAGGHDAAPATYVVSCSLPRPDLGALDEVAFTAQPNCVMASGDSISLQQVLASAVPLVDGTTLYARGDFVLASQPSAEIRMFVYPASVTDCVAGVASSPAGQFEVWGTVGGVPDGGTTTISIDYAYGTTSTDCRHELVP